MTEPEISRTQDTFAFIRMGADEINKLTVKKAGDRQKMARWVEDVLSKCGATGSPEDGVRNRTITILVQGNRGLLVYFDIDGKCLLGDGAFVLPWHMSHESDDRLVVNSFGGA